MILVDTSVWIEVLKDKTGDVVRAFKSRIGNEVVVFSRFVQLELLQGANDEHEWSRLEEYLSAQYCLKHQRIPGGMPRGSILNLEDRAQP